MGKAVETGTIGGGPCRMTLADKNCKNLCRIADSLVAISDTLDSILEEMRMRPYVRPPDFSVSNPFSHDTGTGDAKRL